MDREIEFKLTEEMILHLLKGKRIEYIQEGMPKVRIYPPQGRITMTHKEFDQLSGGRNFTKDEYELHEKKLRDSILTVKEEE